MVRRQSTERFTGCAARIDRLRFREGAFARDIGEGVERRVARGDLRQMRLDDGEGGEGAFAHPAGDVRALHLDRGHGRKIAGLSASSGRANSVTRPATSAVRWKLTITPGRCSGAIGMPTLAATRSI